MKRAGHTPSPCPFCDSTTGLSFDPDGVMHRVACDCGARGPDTRDEARAVREWNERGDLSAAAPLMLEALENLENDDGSTMPPSAWALVQAAIAQARGES